jgi:hypothetical protein
MRQDWAAFSQGATLTKAKFDCILHQREVPFGQSAFDMTLANIGVRGPAMTHDDFARFCRLHEHRHRTTENDECFFH